MVHIRDIALGVSLFLPCLSRSTRSAAVLMTCPQIRDYPTMLAECVRVLKPGGYLVVQEMEWLVDYLTDDLSASERCPIMYK